MQSALTPPLLLLLSYLIGALPFAVWVAKIKGIDPRKSGSKNPGATNVTRTAGLPLGLLTLLLDALKGTAAVLLLTPHGGGWAAAAGWIAVFGHCTSPFLGWRGGRGVATTGGALLTLHLGLGLAATLTWVLALLITRRAAWASLTLSLGVVILSLQPDVPSEVKLFSACAGALIAARHWEYLKALLPKRAPTRTAPQARKRPKR
jgi:glycerol-3-phosphate acyltransferase PlsY